MTVSPEALGRLRRRYVATYGAEPGHVARAPGRVNLLGEHTDYNGLPVLPMALQKEARLVFSARDDGRVRITNLDDRFDPVDFEIHPGLSPSAAGSWENYCKAPANELARRYAIWRGFDAVFESTVPVAAGLSSSSALVNVVGLALARLNEVGLDALGFADLMAEAERFTGTRGGGMDQAISMAGQEGCATRIGFEPLSMRHVRIPNDWCFIVADTCVVAEKSGGAQLAYNRRRSECEEAVEVVASHVVEQGMTGPGVTGYRDLLRSVGLDGALAAAEEALDGNLLRRFRHVVTEADRVEAGADLILSADLDGFGTLMDGSHGSLHGDFQVSSRELDEVVAIAREGGAVGARLTGAGFGGCTVSLASPASVDGVIDALVEEYYEPRGLTSRLEDKLFVAIPSGGASVDDLTAP